MRKERTSLGQITTGIRSILDNSFIYIFSQIFFVGGIFEDRKWNTAFVSDFVRPQSGAKILDIGCGPAEILSYLPGVSYWGFDISPAYIGWAQKRNGTAGHFFCKELTSEDLESLPKFDITLAIGVLHHLDDANAASLLELAHNALKPGGRLITVDACFTPKQNPIARHLISWDRGQNVRTSEGYTALLSKVFPEPHVEIRHRSWIPYTHCLTECTRT